MKLFSKYFHGPTYVITVRVNVTDWRTDRKTDGQTTYGGITALCVASHSKNSNKMPCATSDCPRLRFCQLTDILRVTNYRIVSYRIMLSQGEPRDTAISFDTTASCMRLLWHSMGFLYRPTSATGGWGSPYSASPAENGFLCIQSLKGHI